MDRNALKQGQQIVNEIEACTEYKERVLESTCLYFRNDQGALVPVKSEFNPVSFETVQHGCLCAIDSRIAELNKKLREL